MTKHLLPDIREDLLKLADPSFDWSADCNHTLSYDDWVHDTAEKNLSRIDEALEAVPDGLEEELNEVDYQLTDTDKLRLAATLLQQMSEKR